MRKKLYLIFLINMVIKAKVLIITPAFNKPNFIIYQYKTFKKFLKDDYEYMVFNDASDSKIQHRIETVCEKLKIKCIRMPQEIHKVDKSGNRMPWMETHAAFRHGNVIQYAFDQVGLGHNDIFVIIDSDMFLTKPFSIREFMKNYSIGGLGGVRGFSYPFYAEHPWPQFCVLDLNKIPCKKSILLKAGFSGNMYMEPGNFLQYFIAGHPELKVTLMKQIYYLRSYQNQDLLKIGFSSEQIEFIKKYDKIYNTQHERTYDETYFVNNTFLHFTMSHSFDIYSNYTQEFKKNKHKLFHEFLVGITRSSSIENISEDIDLFENMKENDEII